MTETVPEHPAPAVPRRRARRAGVAGLLVLGCGLAALSVLAIWLRVTLLDTDRYVATVGPIAEQPAVQQAVAAKLNAAIDAKVDLDSIARSALPARADPVIPALVAGLQSVIHSRVQDLTTSDAFVNAWKEANRRAHSRLVELLTGGRSKRLELDEDTVYLDFGGDIDRIRDGLRERGYDRLADSIPDDVDARIALVQSSALVDAQAGVKLLKGVAIVLPLLALACLAAHVLLSRPRRRGLLRAAAGVAAAMVLLIAALAVARSAYLDALGANALPRDAASSIFDAVAELLRTGIRFVVLLAAVVAGLALVAGLPVRRAAWIAGHRRQLQLAVAGAGALTLLLWDTPTPGVVLGVLLVAALLIAGIEAAGSGRPGLTNR
jgi:hypothetical protein